MDKQGLINKIIEFNNDSTLLALREKYSEASFFEIISKERSETTFSAFLKWLFQGDFTKLSCSSPVEMLLDILASNDSEQIISEDLKTALITRKFHIKSVQVEAEKSVRELASEAIADGELDKEERLLIASNCQDRIDIFIECLCDYEGETCKIQIIIENKVDSREGGKKSEKSNLPKAYTDENQTTRYYLGTHRNAKDNKLHQFYVYLSKGKDKETEENVHPKFIHVTYQDILDRVIVPILNISSLSTRSRFFLEEFKNELSFPSLEGESIATDSDTQGMLSKIFTHYEELITQSIIATSDTQFWKIKDTYYDQQPKEKLLIEYLDLKKDDLLKEEWISADEREKYKPLGKTEWYYNSGKPYKNLLEITRGDGKLVAISDKTLKPILVGFCNENKKIIRAILGNVKQKERIKCLVDAISKRDDIRLKYYVYYDDKKLNKSALSNAETAFSIIKQYIEYKKQEITLDELNETFSPVKVNTYYLPQKGWFNQLFYPLNPEGIYKTPKGDEVYFKDDKMDFFQDIEKQRHCLKSSGDKSIIMLKMWRTSDLNLLIDYVQKIDGFGEKIKVVIAGKDTENA